MTRNLIVLCGPCLCSDQNRVLSCSSTNRMKTIGILYHSITDMPVLFWVVVDSQSHSVSRFIFSHPLMYLQHMRVLIKALLMTAGMIAAHQLTPSKVKVKTLISGTNVWVGLMLRSRSVCAISRTFRENISFANFKPRWFTATS